MKKRFLYRLKLCLTVLFFTGSAAYAAEQMSVQVKESFVRAEPSFMGKIQNKLVYGDQVDILEEKGGWKKIRCMKGNEGWLHDSALSKKKIVLQSGASDVKQAATGSELALAGKGFNKQVETEFKARNKNIDYRWIDRMETFAVRQSEISKFLTEGDLRDQGGSK